MWAGLDRGETPVLVGVDGSKAVVKAYVESQEQTGATKGSEYVAARTETEKKMVKIWERLLKREKVGVRDNFFELGGKSL